MQEVIHKLETPITYGGKTIDELTFRRPKGKDMRLLKNPITNDDLINVGSKLCSLTRREVDELDVCDVNMLIEITTTFLVDGV